MDQLISKIGEIHNTESIARSYPDQKKKMNE